MAGKALKASGICLKKTAVYGVSVHGVYIEESEFISIIQNDLL